MFVRVVAGREQPITRNEMMRAAMRKIRAQFRGGEDALDIPEAMLMFAIINQAVTDTQDKENPSNRATALRYLRGTIPHAEMCGVDSGWVRYVLTEMGCFDPLPA